MLSALQALFAPQVRNQIFKCLYEFLTSKMEKNTCIKSPLTNMHRLYRRLTDELNYMMTNELGIYGVPQSLPPSYTTYLKGYLMTGFDVTFH
jgi:hypothetical protein